MWVKSYQKLFPRLKKEDVWKAWTNVNHWPQWHKDLEYCKMEGPFVSGNFFILKPKGMKAFKIILTSVEEGHAFTDCTAFLGAKMYDTHTLTV